MVGWCLQTVDCVLYQFCELTRFSWNLRWVKTLDAKQGEAQSASAADSDSSSTALFSVGL
jgi:hypothetical protein